MKEMSSEFTIQRQKGCAAVQREVLPSRLSISSELGLLQGAKISRIRVAKRNTFPLLPESEINAIHPSAFLFSLNITNKLWLVAD
jgi:hypothetical protein